HAARAAAEARLLAQRIERVLEIVDADRLVEALVERERLRPLGLALVGDVDARLLPPEQIGAEHDIALLRQRIRLVAHHLVAAEDLLNQDDPRAFAARWRRLIGLELPAILGGHGDVRHLARPSGCFLAIGASKLPWPGGECKGGRVTRNDPEWDHY